MAKNVIKLFSGVWDDTFFWPLVAAEMDFRKINNCPSDRFHCRYVLKYYSERTQFYLSFHLVHFAVRFMYLLYVLNHKRIIMIFF